MAKKFNNRNLIVILLVLLAAYFLFRQFGSEKRVRTFKSELFQMDTAKVSKFSVLTKAENFEEILLENSAEGWTVSKGTIRSKAPAFRVKGVLDELSRIKPQRLVSRSPEKWAQYQLTDTVATRVQVWEGNKKTVDLLLGKLDFKQQQGQQQFGGRNQPSATTFVRNHADDEVYIVDGMLPLSFNQSFASWRESTFSRFDRESITKVQFVYPADSGFVLQRLDTAWTCNGQPALGKAVDAYLNTLAGRSNTAFEDGYRPEGVPLYRVQFEGNNMAGFGLAAYLWSADRIILHSTLNPEAYFVSDRAALFAEIFKPASTFVKSPS